MPEPDLFTVTHAHAGDPDTSFAAANAAQEFANGHCARIHRLLVIYPDGLTSLEISNRTGLDYHAVARRIKDLTSAETVENSGERRANPNGCMATVWRAR